MPFCRFCGKEINEGETCTCEGAQAEAAKAAAGANASAAGSQAADALKDAAKVGSEVAGKAGVTCLEIIKKPVTEGATFVNGTNHITAIGVIVLQSLLTAVFALLFSLKYNSAAAKSLSGAIFGSAIKISVVKAFFLAILFSLVATLIFSCLTFLMLKILKLQASLYEVLEVAGARASLLSGGIAISAVLAILYPAGGAALFVLCGLLAFIHVYAVLSKKYADADNKLLYGVIILAIVFVAVAYFLCSRTFSWFLTKEVGKLGGMLSGLF